MGLTKTQITQIIKEELHSVLLLEMNAIEGWAKIKELFDAAESEEDYINAMELARSYKMAFPLTGEDERFMDEIFFNAIFEAVMAGHWDVSNEIEEVWGKNRWREDPEWGGGDNY